MYASSDELEVRSPGLVDCVGDGLVPNVDFGTYVWMVGRSTELLSSSSDEPTVCASLSRDADRVVACLGL